MDKYIFNIHCQILHQSFSSFWLSEDFFSGGSGILCFSEACCSCYFPVCFDRLVMVVHFLPEVMFVWLIHHVSHFLFHKYLTYFASFASNIKSRCLMTT